MNQRQSWRVMVHYKLDTKKMSWNEACNAITVEDLGNQLGELTGLDMTGFISKIHHDVDVVPHDHLADPFIKAILQILVPHEDGRLSLSQLKESGLRYEVFSGMLVLELPPGPFIPLNGYFTHNLEEEGLIMSCRLPSHESQPKEYFLKKKLVHVEDLQTSNLIAFRYGKDEIVTNSYPIDPLFLESIRQDFVDSPRNNMAVPPFAFVNRILDNFFHGKEASERFLSMDKPKKSEFSRGFYVRYILIN